MHQVGAGLVSNISTIDLQLISTFQRLPCIKHLQGTIYSAPYFTFGPIL